MSNERERPELSDEHLDTVTGGTATVVWTFVEIGEASQKADDYAGNLPPSAADSEPNEGDQQPDYSVVAPD